MREVCQWTTQILSVIISVLFARSKEKKNMMVWIEVSNIISLLIFLSFAEWQTAVVTLLINIRCICILFKDKIKYEKLVFNLLVFLHIPILVWCLYDICKGNSPVILLPWVSCLISTFSYWYQTPKGIKITGIFISIFWIIYDLHITAYVSTALNIWSVVVTVFYLVKYKIESSKTEEVLQ